MKKLIGKKAKGFKFKESDAFHYMKDMDKHIGEVGTIIDYDSYSNTCAVHFNDEYWYYPASEIEKHLVSDSKRGDRVLVRNYDSEEWKERIFLTKIRGAYCSFVCVGFGYEEDFLENRKFNYTSWKQIKPIEKKTEVTLKEVTLEEIAKKFGVELENLKIKK